MSFTPRFIMLGGAALLSLPTFAGAPTPFDQWSVNKGTVASACSSGLTCEVISSGPGFMQQKVTDGVSNLSYIKTIVTAPDATGVPSSASGLPFSNENFVKMGTADQVPENGVASKFIMHAESNTASTTAVFDTRMSINSGWAATNGTPNIDISQLVSETNADGSVFSTSSRIQGNNDASGAQTGSNISLETLLSQPKGTNDDGTSSGGSGWGGRGGSGGGSGSGSSSNDVQVFHLRRVGGNMLTTAGKGTVGNKSVSWKPGDVAQTVWLGQGFDFGSFGGSGVMGFQSYDNLSDSVAQISTSSTSSAGPFSWVDPPFGAAPVMPANGGSGGGGSSGGWGR